MVLGDQIELKRGEGGPDEIDIEIILAAMTPIADISFGDQTWIKRSPKDEEKDSVVFENASIGGQSPGNVPGLNMIQGGKIQENIEHVVWKTG